MLSSSPRQSIPHVFIEIMANQEERARMHALPAVPFHDYVARKRDMDACLRPAAQALLRRPGGNRGRRS
jgi:hypothetical protein